MRDTYLGEGIFSIESAGQDVSSKRSQQLIQPGSLGSARNLELSGMLYLPAQATIATYH